MAKALNLDALAQEKRTVTIGGVTYPVIEMTVQNFIETSKEADKLKNSDNVAEQLESTLSMICRSIPEMPKEVLDTLSMEQLAAIAAFVHGADSEDEPKSKQEGGAGKKPKK